MKKAEEAHYKLLDLVKAMFIETNPIPVKTAMGLMKMIDPEMRLPLCEMATENKEKLVKVLKEYKLI
jgi:4-hydroxy-tetrahydrodipicolinate synthase